ncbi:MAG: tetratricopeptide repeat protein [Atribacterota bacterium]|nr:tetratricopeptide repeat protein [Atribacterota bacterium]
MFYINLYEKYDYSQKDIVKSKRLLIPYVFYLILLIILFCTIFNTFSIALESKKFAVYYFNNLTGSHDWEWLEKGFPDMLCQTFSQSEKINHVPIEEIEKLTDIDNESYHRLAETSDLNLFRSLSNLLKSDLIFTASFSLKQKEFLSFNLIMYQAQLDELFELKEMTVIPEDLFYLKENIARAILQEAKVLIDDELDINLKKNISSSLIALRNYYQSIEYKNKAIAEYQGVDFPSKPFWKEAMNYGEKAVSEDPYFAEAYYLLSQIYERTKWTFREITSLEKFIETAKNNTNIKVSYQRLSEAFYRLAYSKYEQNDITSALEYSEDAIFYQANNVKARIFLMRLYYDTGQISKALEQAEEIKKIETGNQDIEWFFRQYQQAEIYGKETYELYVTGYNAYSNKKWVDAISLLTKAINLNQEFKEAHYFLGLSYYHAGDIINSIRYLEEAVRLDPFDSNARIYLNKAIEEREFGREAVWTFNQGYQYYISGEYEEALLRFKESAQKNPNFEKTRIYLMRTYYHLNQMDEYLAERERIGGDKVFDIDWEKEYYQLAYNFYSLGNYEIALDKLNEVLEVNPDFLEARFLIAETLYNLGKYNEANQHYKYIINNYIDSMYYENALLGNGWCSYLLGDYAEAEISLELLVKNYSGSTLYQEGIYKLGKIYFQQKKYTPTINLYENLLVVDSLVGFDKFEIRYILGQSYFWEGIYDRAKVYFADIINNKPSFELIDETRYYYSYALFREGNYQEARKILEELVKKESQIKDETSYLLARVLLEQKEYDRVIDINSSLIEKTKDIDMLERLLFDLGLAYSRKGEDSKAILFFERALNQFRDGELSKIVSLELAQSYYHLGQYQEVLTILDDLDSKEALELKIDAASKMNNEEKLLDLYRGFSNQYPDGSLAIEGFFSMAKSKYEKGEYQEALNLFQEIESMITQAKMRQEIIYWQGLSLYRLENYLKAEEYFQSVDHFAGDEIAIRSLYMVGETCYKQEKYSEAIQHYQDFLKYYSSHSLAAHAKYSVSWSYLNIKDYSKAIESFSNLVQDFPDSQFTEESNFLIGKIYFLANNNNDSRVTLQEFMMDYAESNFAEEALYIVAQIYLDEEKWIDSIINFEKLIDQFPDSHYLPGSLYGLCLSYFKKGEYEKALHVGDRYLDNIPTGVFVCDILYITSICLEDLGYQSQAKERYEIIMKNCSDTSYVDSVKRQLE